MSSKPIDKDEFVRQYAANSGLSIPELLRYRVPIPAALDWPSCDREDCQGWHMISRSYAEEWWVKEVEQGIRDKRALEFLP